MAEYIDRALLRQDLSESVVFSERYARRAELRGARKIAERIEAAPVVDAVPVVRCKDCRNSEKVFPHRNTDLLKCEHSLDYLTPDDFCSYGERKDGDE